MGLREVPDKLAKFVDALCATDGLTVKGKSQSTFYIGSKSFLHFHDGPAGLEADVKWADKFERIPVETHAQRVALLRRINEHLASRG